MILPLDHPVERALAASALLPHDGVVLVAVSGGADSMALVEALRARKAAPRVLVVAHLDHRLREGSVHDAALVREYALGHGLALISGSDDVARKARAHRISIEEAARDARYAFFEHAAASARAACVLTAHTRTDQVETILMRILRGSGHVGVAGIPKRRGPFVRPLLDVTRAETRDYCAARGVDFTDDPSNNDVRFFRNRVRHEILPTLRVSFPKIDDVLLRLAETARRENLAFATRTDGWLRDHLNEEAPGVWTLTLAGFDEMTDDDARSLLRDALAHAGLARDVGRVHYERLLEMVRSAHPGASADLPGLRARREHDALVLELRGPTRGWRPAGAHKGEESSAEARTTRPQWAAGRQDPRGLLVTIPGRTLAGGWIIEAELVEAHVAREELARASRDASTAHFDADTLATPLRARAPRAGDHMRPFGLEGHKKLSDLFVDRKIPRRRRERAIVVEGDAIHWVPGVATGEVGRVGPATKRVLRLKATLA